MKFYHVYVYILGITSEFHCNLSRDEAILKYVCPYINKEIIPFRAELRNLSQWGIVNVFSTDRPIDSSWPIPDKKSQLEDYDGNLRKHLWEKLNANVTEEIFRDAVRLIANGDYKAIADQIREELGRRECFFICPMENEEVNHNYEFVIKPLVKQFQFDIHRVDEISHTEEVNHVILETIERSKFLIADLTDERQNCYYELGYAHALRKPAIIIAKEGTKRHFDISTYKWNYWETYKDLKPLLENELISLVSKWKDVLPQKA